MPDEPAWYPVASRSVERLQGLHEPYLTPTQIEQRLASADVRYYWTRDGDLVTSLAPRDLATLLLGEGPATDSLYMSQPPLSNLGWLTPSDLAENFEPRLSTAKVNSLLLQEGFLAKEGRKYRLAAAADGLAREVEAPARSYAWASSPTEGPSTVVLRLWAYAVLERLRTQRDSIEADARTARQRREQRDQPVGLGVTRELTVRFAAACQRCHEAIPVGTRATWRAGTDQLFCCGVPDA